MVTEKNLSEFYDGKKVFITGHTGFKGSWLSLWLKLLGANLRGYALEPEREHCIYNLTTPYSADESVIADIRDLKRISKELTNFSPDIVFHLAAQPLVRESYEIPSETFDVNVTGTANVLEAVKNLKKKCTAIIITTDKVYENKETEVLYNEADVLGGYDPYSASKACAEIVVNCFRNSFFNTNNYTLHQKSIASVRAGNVIGGGDYSKDRIIPDIVESLTNGEEILVRNPDAVRPWQHVLEPLGGYLLLAMQLYNDNNFSGAYNFGPNPEDHLLVRELVEKAIKVWGSGRWVNPELQNQPHEAGLLKLDITKAKKVLGWQPKLNASEAISLTIDWYKNAPTDAYYFSTKQIKDYMDL